MPRYYVVTPVYETSWGVYGPPDWGADCVEVEARNKREARVIGLRLIRKQSTNFFDILENNACPYKYLEVEAQE